MNRVNCGTVVSFGFIKDAPVCPLLKEVINKPLKHLLSCHTDTLRSLHAIRALTLNKTDYWATTLVSRCEVDTYFHCITRSTTHDSADGRCFVPFLSRSSCFSAPLPPRHEVTLWPPPRLGVVSVGLNSSWSRQVWAKSWFPPIQVETDWMYRVM